MARGRLHNLSLSLSSAFRWRKRAKSDGAWGDGLADETSANIWYRSTWADVDADELVYLIPSLATAKATRPDCGPAVPARRALSTHVYRAAGMLRTIAGDEGDGSSEALDLVASSGVLTTIDPVEAWFEGQVAVKGARERGYGSAEDYRAADPKAERDGCVFALAVVSCLDRLHRDARGLAPRDGVPASQQMPLPDALVASIHATLNAAYVYPQFAPIHEVLSVGAWLGHLVNGRAAYMPEFVGAYLATELDPKRQPDASAGGQCTRILRSHADQAVGVERLHGLARRVASSGRPVLVKPRPMTGLGFTPYLWNASLRGTIARRLEAQLFAV